MHTTGEQHLLGLASYFANLDVFASAEALPRDAAVSTLHPTPYTLHPTPYTLYPTPYTLHPTPYALRPRP